MHLFSWKSVKSVPVIDHPLWSNAYMRREIWVIFGSGNGLSPVWRQAITWTNDDPLPRRVHVLLIYMSYNRLDISDITRRAAHNTATAIVVKRWVSYWVISVVCVCVFLFHFFFLQKNDYEMMTAHCIAVAATTLGAHLFPRVNLLVSRLFVHGHIDENIWASCQILCVTNPLESLPRRNGHEY